MRKRMWGFGILGAGAVAALVAATIPPATPDPSAQPSTAPGYSLVTPAASAKPGIIEEARTSVDESAAVFAARMAVSAVCMEKAGFPQFAETELGNQGTSLSTFILGFQPMDVATARSTGYPYPKGRETTLEDGLIQAFKGAPQTQESFSGGSPGSGAIMTGGCERAGIEAVYGSANEYAEATGAYALVLPGTESAKQDPERTAVLAEWQNCMSAASYDGLKSPGQASSVAAQQGGQAFLKIAVADATCREQLHVEKRLEDIAARYLTTVVAERQQQLAQVAAIRAAAEHRAQALAK